MKTDKYRPELLERLKDPEYAVLYLTETLVNENQEAFLIALRDVIDARSENLSNLAEQAGITRQALYHSLSEKGNPTLATLQPLLKSLGFSLGVNLN